MSPTIQAVNTEADFSTNSAGQILLAHAHTALGGPVHDAWALPEAMTLEECERTASLFETTSDDRLLEIGRQRPDLWAGSPEGLVEWLRGWAAFLRESGGWVKLH